MYRPNEEDEFYKKGKKEETQKQEIPQNTREIKPSRL